MALSSQWRGGGGGGGGGEVVSINLFASLTRKCETSRRTIFRSVRGGGGGGGSGLCDHLLQNIIFFSFPCVFLINFHNRK